MCSFGGPGLTGLSVWLTCIAAPDPVWKLLLAFLTPSLVVVSLVLAARSISNTRAIARQKATIDLIEKAESTQHYRDQAAAFVQARDGQLLGKLGNPTTEYTRKLRRDVLGYLNHYEIIAIGIEDNILDEAIYRKWIQSSAVADWNDAKPFIQGERWRLNEERTGYLYHPELFVRFERAVCRWSTTDVGLDRNSSPPPPLPSGEIGPGDAALPVTRPIEE